MKLNAADVAALIAERDAWKATVARMMGDEEAMRDERDRLRADLQREREVRRIIDQALLQAVTERDRLRALVAEPQRRNVDG
jgi:hypothetical protein